MAYSPFECEAQGDPMHILMNNTPAMRRNRKPSSSPSEAIKVENQAAMKSVGNPLPSGRSPPVPYRRTVEAVNARSALSLTEQREFTDCEAIIEKGWETFVEVGRALARIRDKKLYRSEHDTFEAYCREKWQYAKSHVYRLIGAAEVLTCLSPIGDIPVPSHEAQVRPLIGLEPEKALAAWKRAVEKAHGAMITAKLVKEAVAEAAEVLFQRPPKAKTRTTQAEHYRQKLDTALILLKQMEDSLRKKQGVSDGLTLLAQIRKCLMGLKMPPREAPTPAAVKR